MRRARVRARNPDPLDTAEGPWAGYGSSGVTALEACRASTRLMIDGLVLRYGRFYGPGTWTATPQGTCTVARGCRRRRWRGVAVTRGGAGHLQRAEDDGMLWDLTRRDGRVRLPTGLP